MAHLFRCKMCGGQIEFEHGATVGMCDSCGTRQTLPRLDDERRANLYDRANHFRRANEYDKALGIYEQILNEDNTDAEAHWSIVLCKYGIEYVEDPVSHKRIPTVNRARFTSVFQDEDYKAAIQNADDYQKEIYAEEAKAIDDVQKGILAISQQEEPFDVFICYKETDTNGRRTQDSVIANDLYNQLTKEGLRVFFSRITLEDKLGSAYEPYIFAALNSAKVMIVIGTKAEYFNAVWVKNEWSRYLAIVQKSNGSKVLIPAYKDMDPYDMPTEFSHLQAQDINKLGFLQDLIRGVKKIVGKDKPQPTGSSGNASSSIESLLKRGQIFLEDKDYTSAISYADKVLDASPENAEAYVIRALGSFRCSTLDELENITENIRDNVDLQKALKFSNEIEKAKLNSVIEQQETNRYKYQIAKANQLFDQNTTDSLQQAIQIYSLFPQDTYAKERIQKSQTIIRTKEHIENQKKKKKRIRVIVSAVAIVIAIAAAAGFLITGKSRKYNTALAAYNSGDYPTAVEQFTGMNYKDSEELLIDAKYKYIQKTIKDNNNQVQTNISGFPNTKRAHEYLLDLQNESSSNIDVQSLTDDLIVSWIKYIWKQQGAGDSENLSSYLTYLHSKNIGIDSVEDSIYEMLISEFSSFTDCFHSNGSYSSVKPELYFKILQKFCDIEGDAKDFYTFMKLIMNWDIYELDYTYVDSDRQAIKNIYNSMPETRNIIESGLINGNYRFDSIPVIYKGNWSSSDGMYYMNVSDSGDGSYYCEYNVPHDSNPNTAYWNLNDHTFEFLDSNNNKVADVYKFEFSDLDTLRVYSYSDGNTYILYRR